MWIDGSAARQPAHQRDHGNAAQRPPRHRSEAEAQGSAPADADRHAVLQPLRQRAAGGGADHMAHQRGIGWCRDDDRLIDSEPVLDLVLEFDAVGEPAGDRDLHHALLARLGEQPVDADAVDAELLADLRLGQAGNEIEPCGPRRELFVAIDG